MKKLITLMATTLLSVSAHAGLFTLESRQINAAIDDTDFVSSWNNQTSAISSSMLDSFTMKKTGNNTLNYLSFDFNLVSNDVWGFEAGLDAGYGAQLLIDGSTESNRTDNLWWNYNWNSSDVMRSHDIALSSGSHTFELYWAENCCNGASSLRFTTDGENWNDLTGENIAAVTVPAPQTAFLFIAALTGGMLLRSRKSAVEVNDQAQNIDFKHS